MNAYYDPRSLTATSTTQTASVAAAMVDWLYVNQLRIDQAVAAGEKVIVRLVIQRNGALHPELTIRP